MQSLTKWTAIALALAGLSAITPPGDAAQAPKPGAAQQVDLAERLAAGKIRVVNRDITAVQGTRAVHLSPREGNGIAWIEGTDFSQGTIELDVRGKDVFQQSFLGVAFHRRDDNAYEAVYLRPFNFRATDPVRHQHAVQYIAFPDFDWPKLRQDFPEEFENPVDQAIDPISWVRLRVVVSTRTIQIHVGNVTSPTLEVRKLGPFERGAVGLWVGNTSDGDFMNLRITPAK